MPEFIHEHSTRVKDEDGTDYVVRIYGQDRLDGTWEGWLEFHPMDKRKPTLRTEQETSPSNCTLANLAGNIRCERGIRWSRHQPQSRSDLVFTEHIQEWRLPQ
jgi:hypothetical protein